jgi:hypothetical protein
MEISQMATANRSHGNGSHKSHNGRSTSHGTGMSKSNTGSRGRRGSAVSVEWLRNFLSEMLAVEKELEAKLTEFLNQTHRHVELCTSMLEAIGEDADFQSPGAQAAEHKAEGLISAEVPPEMQDLNNIENLVLAETKDHWNWETLASIAPKIGDPELKRAATKAISEVRRQEKTHVDWNEKTLSKLAMESAMHPPADEMSESEAGERDEDETSSKEGMSRDR